MNAVVAAEDVLTFTGAFHAGMAGTAWQRLRSGVHRDYASLATRPRHPARATVGQSDAPTIRGFG